MDIGGGGRYEGRTYQILTPTSENVRYGFIFLSLRPTTRTPSQGILKTSNSTVQVLGGKAHMLIDKRTWKLKLSTCMWVFSNHSLSQIPQTSLGPLQRTCVVIVAIGTIITCMNCALPIAPFQKRIDYAYPIRCRMFLAFFVCATHGCVSNLPPA